MGLTLFLKNRSDLPVGQRSLKEFRKLQAEGAADLVRSMRDGDRY